MTEAPTGLRTGTAPRHEHLPGLRLEPLAAFLAEQLPAVDAEQPLVATLLAGGRSNLTYRIDQGDCSWVLRRPPLGHVMPKAHDMSREFRVLRALAVTDVPVPRPHLLCVDETVIGAPFLVMEYVAGTVYSVAEDTSAIGPARAQVLTTALVETLADLHDAPVEGTPLAGLGRPSGHLERQVALWRAQWERTKSRDLEGVDQLTRWLVASTPQFADRPAAMTHGDYRLDNVIFASDDAVRAVLDWEMATVGDPVCDIALLLVYWTETGDLLRRAVPVAEGVTSRPGFDDRLGVLSRYRARRPVDDDHLAVCLGLACLKLAVVMESIAVRHQRGEHRGSDASAMGGAAPALIDMGLRVAAGGGIEAIGS